MFYYLIALDRLPLDTYTKKNFICERVLDRLVYTLAGYNWF